MLWKPNSKEVENNGIYPSLGSVAPSFTLPATDGRSYSLKDFDSEYVVVFSPATIVPM